METFLYDVLSSDSSSLSQNDTDSSSSGMDGLHLFHSTSSLLISLPEPDSPI